MIIKPINPEEDFAQQNFVTTLGRIGVSDKTKFEATTTRPFFEEPFYVSGQNRAILFEDDMILVENKAIQIEGALTSLFEDVLQARRISKDNHGQMGFENFGRPN